MARTVGYFPLAGAFLGALLALLYTIGTQFLPAAVALCLTLVASLLLTGAFHEDGLADTFDGLGATRGRDDALRIMRDSRIGSYGTLALIGSFALRWAALAALEPLVLCAALVAGHGLSRLSAVLVIAGSRYQREEGTGKPVADGMPPGSLRLAVVTGVVLAAGWVLLLPPAWLLCALAGLAVAHLWLRRLVEQRIGGYTGDTLGAVQQVSEIGFYLGCAAGLGLPG
jgi:adenosylcobinamide-GDP ribazoletransferase